MRPLSPVKGSVYSKLPQVTKDLLIHNGAVPVNDVFFDLWNNYDKILMLYGGFGSGKSVFIVDKLLNKCLTSNYFRCFYGRKVYDTVRISVFATLCDRIEELKLTHKFSYSRADNSSMIIRCRETGNTFNPFGADNVDKLKSVKDPSDIFCEELDQFTEVDFGVLISRLRTSKAKTQFLAAFNSTKVTNGHWLKLAFFDEESEKRQQYANYVINKIFCNYTDNYFINHKEYEQTLWIAAAFNEVKFNEIAGGDWGSEQLDNLFIYSLREKVYPDKKPGYPHITIGMLPDYKEQLIISFDFNVEPITALVIQHSRDLSKVRILQEYRLLNSDIFELCERIKTDHAGAYFMVTGDASGKNRTAITRGNKNYYQLIQQELMLTPRQILLPNSNPSIADTRVLCNALLAKHPDYLINDSCRYLLDDIRNVTTDGTGGIDKSKDAHKTHLLDCFRYYNYVFHNRFLVNLAS